MSAKCWAIDLKPKPVALGVLAAVLIVMLTAGCAVAEPAVHLPAASERCYSRLTGDEAALYDRMTGAIYEYGSFSLSFFSDIKADTLTKIHGYVLADHPDIFWVGELHYTTIGDRCVNYEPQYTMVRAEAERAAESIEQSVAGIIKAAEVFSSDYDRAVFVHDYLVGAVRYDKNGENESRFDVRGVFSDRLAVCAGYAKAFQLIMQRMSIECFYVTGMAGEISHAWNIVKLDGDYTSVDVTYDDPLLDGGEGTSHAYFGFTSADVAAARSVDSHYPYPEPVAMRYLERKGLSGDSIDGFFDQLASAAAANIQKGDYSVEFVSQAFEREVKDSRLLGRLITAVNDRLGGEAISYSLQYSLISEMAAVKLFFEPVN